MVEVDPHLKDELYIELARQRLTLKAWFLFMAKQFLGDSRQPRLFAAEGPPKPYPSPKGSSNLSMKQ